MSIDWSELPQELLEIIACKLKIYIDYVRFRAVCVKWRSYVSPKPHHLPTQLPWLVFPRSFLDLSTNKFHELNLMESRDSRCCGSSQGWLVFVEKFTPEIRLINPLTRNVIHLPPLTTFPNVLDFNISKPGQEYLIQPSRNGPPYTLSLLEMRDWFIKKVVLSSNPNSLENDYIALVMLSRGELAFHKKGVEEWSIIEVSEADEYPYYKEAIYYNGAFYVVNLQSSITIYDLRGVFPIVTLITLPPKESHGLFYLVDSFGKLMLVDRYMHTVERKFDLVWETVDFYVFKYDSSEPGWIQMDTLGDHMLFLDGYSSVCLSASDFSGCEKNCIYFSSEEENKHDDFGVYHLDDSSIVPLPYDHGSARDIRPPPFWVTPNPC